MPAKRYHVMLSRRQRETLMDLTSSGIESARKLTRARILLKVSDAGELGPAYADEEIKAALDVSLSTIQRTRKAFVLHGLTAALNPKERKASRPEKFDGEKEAHLIALVCSQAPEGFSRWTLRLLAEKMVELNHFSSISHETIRRVLKKTHLDLG